ncbi:MAG: OmpA family protein [Cyclobacteriaceae bacterium]
MKACYFLIILFLGFSTFGQDGDSYFESSDYYNASRYYEFEVKKDPSKYLNLAKSYFGLKQFDKAIRALEKYKTAYSSADVTMANQLITLLKRDDDAVELRPVEEINTSDHEYSPLISKDGQVLYFVGYDRSGGKGGEDIFYSNRQEDGSWGTPKPFNAFNTDSHETLKAISSDNNAVILFGNYPGSFGSGDLFYSINVDGSWTSPCNLGGDINTDAWESQANLSSDGRFMLFASKRDGALGEADIYLSELTDEGWTTPVNLGNTINTESDERTPFLAGDGKTLYFSSEGHFGFGSYDLFVSKRLDDSWTNWSEPVNMGKYINTLGGDTYFSIPESGSRAYIVGSGGIETNGSDDIFEFILPPSIRPEALFNVYGTVLDENDSAAAVVIKYYNIEDGKEVAKTISDAQSGEYAVSLPSYKKYQVVIDMKGFLYYSAILDLTDPSKYFKKRSFEEILGDQYDLLVESKSRIDKNSTDFDTYLGADENADMMENFGNLLDVSLGYDKESFEIDRILKDARYKYLSELENQREVIQDHDVTRIKVGAKFEVKNIFFDFGKASLREDSKEELDKLYDIMNRSEIVIEFGGHSDNVGSDEANLNLSQERVNSVKDYLVNKGINAERIAAVGYGESQPIASNDTEEGRQKNRRVELKITSLRLQREGADEISANEEYDGLKDESLLAAGSSVQADLLEKFRKAAEAGGLPSGSDCSNETNDVSYTNNSTPKSTKSSNSNFNFSGFDEVDDLDDYIFKRFNPFIGTYGTAPYGGSMGAGAIFVKESNFREISLSYNFTNPDVYDWSAQAQILWTINAVSPLHLHYGVELGMIAGDFFNDNPDVGEYTGYSYVNIPVGARYIFDVSGIKFGPEFMMSFQGVATDAINDVYGAKSKYTRFGVNARWKFAQGGLFLNRGDFVNYFGFRAGLAL